MTDCPFCAEPAEADALKCKSCGESLVERESTQGSDSTKTVLVVVGIIAALAVLLCIGLGTSMTFGLRSAKGRAVQAKNEADMQVLKVAINMYKTDMGAPPKRLNDLLTAPANARGWKGPYLAPPQPLDAWGNPYLYRQGPSGYTITSYGSDGVPGGTGDAADTSLMGN